MWVADNLKKITVEHNTEDKAWACYRRLQQDKDVEGASIFKYKAVCLDRYTKKPPVV